MTRHSAPGSRGRVISEITGRGCLETLISTRWRCCHHCYTLFSNTQWLQIVFCIITDDECENCSCEFIDFSSPCLRQISSTYIRQQNPVNGHDAYISEDYKSRVGLWFCKEESVWIFGPASEIGKCVGYLYLRNQRSNSTCFSCAAKSGTLWTFDLKGKPLRCESLAEFSCLNKSK